MAGQLDPNQPQDPARIAASAATIHSAGNDSSRAPGFGTPVSAPEAAAPVAAAPAAAPVAAAPTDSAGILAARATTPHSGPSLLTRVLWSGDLTGVPGFLKQNNSPLQDINQALQLGRTVTDSDWAKAGFGPGGAALTSTPLGSVNSASPAPATVPLGVANPTIQPASAGGGGHSACFMQGTQIKMRDGSWKPVEQLRLGDDVMLGGKVTGHGISICDQLFFYGGEEMSGSHVLFDGDDWLRARDCGHILEDHKPVNVFPVVCERHLLVTRKFVSADFAMVDHAENYTSDRRIDMLNEDNKLKAEMRAFIDQYIRHTH